MVGADDTPFLAASDYMAAKIPGAEKVVIPAAGHAVNIDQPQAFIEAVLPFLDGLPRIPAGRQDERHHEAALAAALRRGAALDAGDGAARAASDGRSAPPFIATLSNITPLAFGMDAEETARALAARCNYVSGRPGNEIYLALPQSRRQRTILTATGSSCNSATAGWPAGRATTATTGCGSSEPLSGCATYLVLLGNLQTHDAFNANQEG